MEVTIGGMRPYFTYTPGKDNIIADILSHYPTISLDSFHIEEMNVLSIDDNVFPLSFGIIAREYTKDQELLRKLCTAPDIFTMHEISHGAYLVFRHDKIALPITLVNKVIAWYHSNMSHPGVKRTYESIVLHFYTYNLLRIIKQFINDCDVCR